MNKDQVKGRARKSKDVKQETGKVFGNKSKKGRAAKNIGKAQAAYGDAKQNPKNDRIEY